MATIQRVRIAISGGGVTGPGLMTLYAPTSGSGLTTAAKNWLTAISNIFPNNVTFTFPSSGDELDAATGDLTGAWSGGPGGTVVGSATSSVYAQGVGARVVWNTSTVAAGHRVRGSTFLVPLSSGIFAVDGQVSATVVADVQTKTNAFLTAAGANITVWSRPTPTRPGGTAAVTSATFTGKTSWLRSRRT